MPTSGNALTDNHVVMDHDTPGVARLVRRAAGELWVIGSDGRHWRGESHGGFPVTGSPELLRIAVDATNCGDWCIDKTNAVRRCRGGAGSEHPGGGPGKEIAVHARLPDVIGSDNGLWCSVGQAGWQRLLQPRG